MSHMCSWPSSKKERTLTVFNHPLKTSDKNSCPLSRSAVGSRCLNQNCKTHGPHRVKRFRSRKERSQMRGGGGETQKPKPHHHHCRQQSRRDVSYFCDHCCQRSSNYSSRQDARFPNVVPAAHEPSIITDSRLLGHHGLFNHEVKSIDIERLLSKQRKLKRDGEQVVDNKNSASRTSSISHKPSPLSGNDLLNAEPDKIMTSEREADPPIKAHDDGQEKDSHISQETDVTPRHKPNSVIPEEGRKPHLTHDCRENVRVFKKKVKEDKISTVENTPKNQKSHPVRQMQSHRVSQSPPQLSSSHTAPSSDSEHRADLSSVAESVSAVASSLCGCVRYQLRRRRNLVAESREVLLRALQERHGPRFHENLLKLHRSLSFGSDHTKKVQDPELTIIKEDELLQTDAFTGEFDSSKSYSYTMKTKSFHGKGSEFFSLSSSPQILQNLRKTSGWPRRPEETSASPLDDLLRPCCSPDFVMDVRYSETSDHLFAHSPTSCWEEKHSPSHWSDTFSLPNSKETPMFSSFENSFRSQTRARDGPENSVSNTPTFLTHQAQLLERHSPEPMCFSQKQDIFDTERCSFPSLFTSQIVQPEQSHSFLPFSQSSQPLIHPPSRSHQTDMSHYPPSHVLEKEPAPSQSFLLSPEHWSFHPMRLY